MLECSLIQRKLSWNWGLRGLSPVRGRGSEARLDARKKSESLKGERVKTGRS